MPKKLFQRWIPDHHTVRKTPALQFLGGLLHDPNLFHINRHSASVAFFLGLFLAFQPIPGQVPLAAMGAFLFRCNLPVSIGLVWISNPLTFPIIFYGNYLLGSRILQWQNNNFSFEFSWEWFTTELLTVWQPLFLGSLLAGLFLGCAGYLAVQWLWRWRIMRNWEKRKSRRQQRRP